jgi:N-acetylmuramoyl-L-alanine amidase
VKRSLFLAFRLLAAYGALAAGVWLLALSFSRIQAPDRRQMLWISASGDPAVPLVVIDAGHGGTDRGAAANRLIEKEATLDIARRLQRKLEAAGVRVQMTRQDDSFLSLDERAQIANECGASAFISVHLNTSGSGTTDGRGMETYFCESKSLSAVRQIRESLNIAEAGGLRDLRGKKLAEIIQRITCARTQAANRGVKSKNYTVIQSTACPSVLVECGFMTDAAEASMLRREDYREKLAGGLSEGVCAFLQAQSMKPRRGIILEAPKPGAAANELAVSD